MVTLAKDKSELLRVLKERPLLAQVARAWSPEDPCHPWAALSLKIQANEPGEPGGIGIELAWNEEFPLAKKVRMGSPAYRAGCLPGDGLVQANGHSLIGIRR